MDSKYFGKSAIVNREEDHKFLGVKWALNSDEIVFNIRDLIEEYNNITPITERVILKFVARIFDPIGVLSPAVTFAKLYFQKLCGLKIDWNLPLSEEPVAEWKKLLFGLMKLKPVYIFHFYLDNHSLEEMKSVEMPDLVMPECKGLRFLYLFEIHFI